MVTNISEECIAYIYRVEDGGDTPNPKYGGNEFL
jgi:hypothetical protein